MDHINSARRQEPKMVTKIEKKKRNCWIVDFAVPADQSKTDRKLKER